MPGDKLADLLEGSIGDDAAGRSFISLPKPRPNAGFDTNWEQITRVLSKGKQPVIHRVR